MLFRSFVLEIIDLSSYFILNKINYINFILLLLSIILTSFLFISTGLRDIRNLTSDLDSAYFTLYIKYIAPL